MSDTSAFSLVANLAMVQTTDTVSTLKGIEPIDGQLAFLISKTTIGDNKGGFYRFDASSALAEDLVYMNVVISSMTTTGRWIRVFQKAKVYPQGVMVDNGGVKNFYASGVTNSSGQVVLNLTEENTAGGTKLFNEVWLVTPEQDPSTATGSSPVVGYGVVAADLKTVTCYFSQNNTTTLGSTLLSILGVVINGLKPVPAGVPVQVLISGI